MSTKEKRISTVGGMQDQRILVSQPRPYSKPNQKKAKDAAQKDELLERRKIVLALTRKRRQLAKISTLRKIIIWSVSLLMLASLFFIKAGNIAFFQQHPFLHLYSLLVVFYILSRYVLSWLSNRRHLKQKLIPLDKSLPSVSVVIVAHNEEEAIFRTIETCVKSWYPKDRFEIVVVDDGSTDFTYSEMLRAQSTFPSVTVRGLPKNKGKRYGMAEGISIAKNDVLVFVDSDSFVDPDAIARIVVPFRNSKIAAVSGRTDVENWNTNFLTRLQSFRYFVSFKYMKEAENYAHAVTCCPGCFSAYRRDDLLPLMDVWLGQRFLGKEATFGDDRSLTTMLLRKGRKITYQDDAICTTIVPEHWMKYLKQQARWKKSWIRETFLASGFMWKKSPIVSTSFYLGALFPLATPAVTFYNLIYQPIWNGVPPLFYALGLLVVSVLFSCFYARKRNDRLWHYGLAFMVIHAVFLVWQMPYALLTLRKTQWGTR